MPQSCHNCRFWDQWSEDREDVVRSGLCVRHAPQPLTHVAEPICKRTEPLGRDAFIGVTIFPNTEASQWCGEWKKHKPKRRSP